MAKGREGRQEAHGRRRVLRSKSLRDRRGCRGTWVPPGPGQRGRRAGAGRDRQRRCPVTGRTRTVVDRLTAGCAIVARQRSEALAAWVAAGRRDDLDGWRAALGPLLRLAALAVVAYGVYAIVRAVPWLMWALTAWWLRAAWRATRTPAEDADEPLDDEPDGPDVEPVLALLFEVLGDRDRVHLSTVLAHLHAKGKCEGWKVADLRARLDSLGIPVEPKVKIGGVPTRGVLRDALLAHFPDRGTSPSPATVDAA
ncbi:hypothetical protein VWBp26 [Streptomyces phage VWB]|uniref:Uncharacterized protein n=1 Tax=Streptomyces phage VWB TaxID=10702 RepID=Q6VY63_9CAUD|nr:hypothetical protein VWBp26 [Streptomyces phage VWB]AAR29716.1 hypothetical protein [Streptomyces phage VWB]